MQSLNNASSIDIFTLTSVLGFHITDGSQDVCKLMSSFF